MAAANQKKIMTFRAGEVGFVFYENSLFPGSAPGRTYAFGTISEAAAWLVSQYPDAAPSDLQSRG